MKFLEVGLLEPGPRMQRSLLQGLKKAGLRVRVLEAPEKIRRETMVVLGPGVPAPAKVARRLRELSAGVLVLQAQDKLGKAPHADGVLPVPLSPRDLVVRLPELVALRKRVSRRHTGEHKPPVLRRAGEGILDEATGFYTFRHFKEVLFVEVKRARRYGFPMALALIAFDDLGVSVDGEIREQLFGGLALAIRRSLRDTDSPVQYTADRVLLLMPHTELQGALVVTRRICERVAKASLTYKDKVLRPTVSIGVASATARGRELSFGEMAGKAQKALDYAMVFGGDRVEFQVAAETDEPSGETGSSSVPL